jgi:hypothetical protein
MKKTRYYCKPSDDVCLLLTQAWTPLGVTSAREAFHKLIRQAHKANPSVKAIDANGNMLMYDEWIKQGEYFDNHPFMRGVNQDYPVPTVLVTSDSFFYRTSNPKVTLRMLYKHYNGKCRICGKKKPMSEMSKEHIKPRSKGGGNGPDNLTLTCRDCNSKKGDLFPYLVDGKPLEPVAVVQEKIRMRRPEWRDIVKKEQQSED